MAEIISTYDNINRLINEYKEIDERFVYKQFFQVANKNQWVLNFFSDGQECFVDFYFKKKNKIKIIPRVNSVPFTINFMDYIKQNTYNADEYSSTFSVKNINNDQFNDLTLFIMKERDINVTYKNNKNNHVFESDKGDKLYLTYYSNFTLLVQSRPFYLFDLVINYLSEFDMVDDKKITEWTLKILKKDSMVKFSNKDLKIELGSVYTYLPEAILKTMSSSYILMNSDIELPDYSSLLTGIFRGLEAYLKKVLHKELGYELNEKNTFSMFHSKDTDFILKKNNIHLNLVEMLVKLHDLYRDKRNVYLHTRVIAETTPIIENKEDALNILNNIVGKIVDTHKILKQEII